MKATLEEARLVLTKSKDEMARYYSQHQSPTPVFNPGDKVFLDASDIHTTCPSRKLSDRHLGPYPVECWVGSNAYHLTLPPSMNRLHPVFNVVKLTLAPVDLIARRHAPLPPLLELIDGEEEYVVEEILNSCIFHRKLQYLVKWEGYGVEHNTWEYWDNVGNATDAVNNFHTRNLGAPRHIWALAFGSIPFCPIPPLPFALGQCNSERGVIVRGTPKSSAAPQSSAASTAPPSLRSAKPLHRSALRIQPHWFVHAVRGTPKSSATPQSSTASATLPSLRSALPSCSALPCQAALLCQASALLHQAAALLCLAHPTALVCTHLPTASPEDPEDPFIYGSTFIYYYCITPFHMPSCFPLYVPSPAQDPHPFLFRSPARCIDYVVYYFIIY